jgi:putative transcriptional regulator
VKNRFESFDNRLTANLDLPTSFGTGSFLVAAPSLKGSPFEQTVVFVIQHDKHGTFGVVLNRPAAPELKTAWQLLSGSRSGDSCIVHGGPIGGPVFAIHQEKTLAELEMPGGICVSADKQVLNRLAQRHEADYRIVFGVAGWQFGQLSDEIQQGVWFSLEADPQHLFDDPDFMWENFLRQYGRQVLEEIVEPRHIPENPWLN